MTYYSNKAVLEADDIERVLSDGEVLALPEGRVGLVVCLVVDPASGKQYSVGDTPVSLYLTNGVNHRHLPVESLDAVVHPALADAPAAELPAPEPPAVAPPSAEIATELVPPAEETPTAPELPAVSADAPADSSASQ